MSDAETESHGPPTKQQLQARLDEFETRLDKLESCLEGLLSDVATESALRVSMARLAEALDGEADYASDAGENAKKAAEALADLQNDLESHRRELDTITDGKADTKAQAWAQVVDAARNLQNDGNHVVSGGVVLYKDNVAQATGYTPRHAQNLIEEFGETRAAATWKPYKKASVGTPAQRKRLIIELDRVDGDASG